MYKKIAEFEDERIKVPLPGSRMFKLVGGMWDSVMFYKDVAFWIDESGNVFYETGKYPW